MKEVTGPDRVDDLRTDEAHEWQKISTPSGKECIGHSDRVGHSDSVASFK